MPTLLIIGYVWPEPTSSAAGRHMMEIIQTFLQANWQIVFATPAAETENKANLSELDILENNIELNSDSFDEWLKTIEPDVVIFDRFMMEEQFGWRVARTCPNAIRVLDTEDLHFLRQQRQLSSKHAAAEFRVDVTHETALREIASIYRSDLSLIISSYEMDLLQQLFKLDESLIHYFPLLVHAIKDRQPGYEERKGFVFAGTMHHAPNIEAVRRIKKTLWPAIREQLPEADFYLAASYMTEEVAQMHKPKQGFHVLGHVKDMEGLLQQTRVCLAPLLFGAGIKGKLLEAMEYGVPSVTMPIGAEGITSEADWPGFVSHCDADFITAAVKLYRDKESWEKAQLQGFAVIREKFLADKHMKRLLERVKQLGQGLKEHRGNNFIGRMLQHQSMRSTEYMSRWIDCKNKNSRRSGSD